MTAVASSPNIQTLPQVGWANGDGSEGTVRSTSSEDLPKMSVPRKSAQRSYSSSSIASTTSSSSSSSTISTPAAQTNGTTNGDAGWATRTKKPAARGLWPSSKAEPVAGLSTARPQSVGAGTSGPSAASVMTALNTPTTNGSSQPTAQNQWQQNGGNRPPGPPENPALLHLLPMNGTFESKTITVPFAPDLLRIGRQTNQKTVPTPLNGYFDSKVLSRQHAEIWADRDGKIWIRDVKSSNGTFVNGKRLSQENRDSEPHILKEQDVLELGIDIVSEDQKTVVHHKVAARVERAGLYGFDNTSNALHVNEMEPPGTPGGMSQPVNQNGRSRSSSQGSATNGGRMAAGNGMMNPYGGVAAYHPKWLQPISMEQIVKRINMELRQARIQSADLRHTAAYVDALAADEKLPLLPPQQISSPSRSFTQYPSSPPGPPPSQPLPEAPPEANLRNKVNGLPSIQPLLRRTDTERPKSSTPLSGRSSPTKSGTNSQIRTLVEALTTAQKEITAQNARLKEAEEALCREREDRKSAEDRAVRLESGASAPPTPPRSSPVQEHDAAQPDVVRLQSLLDTMRAEMGDMKAQMERYRARAETAEEEGQRDRTSLEEMVEGIRRRDEAVKRRKERRSRSGAAGGDGARGGDGGTDSEDGEVEELDRVLDGEVERAVQRLNGGPRSPEQEANGYGHGNGNGALGLSAKQRHAMGSGASSTLLLHPPSPRDPGVVGAGADAEADASSGRAARAGGPGELFVVQGAPYASLVGVVLLGVGMMAYMNGWQRGE